MLSCVGLFVALLASLEIGRRIGRRMRADKDDVSTGPADGVVYTVYGLIVAFTFSTSAARFDGRRNLIVDQANALGTAALRLDALDPADRPPIRRLMLRWTELAQHIPAITDEAAMNAVVNEAAQTQSEVWRLASAAVERKREPQLWSFVMTPINEWIDLSTTRLATNVMGTPPLVLPTVIALSLVAAVLAGFHMSQRQRRNWLHYLAFAGSISLLIYVILDLNHPRSGIIRVSNVNQAIRQVEQSLRHVLDQG